MKLFDFVKIVDVNGLIKQLSENPQLWDEHPNRRVAPGSPHAQMVDIWVRFGDLSHDMRGEHDSVWYPCSELLTEAKRIAFEIMSAVNGERLGGILITKLNPGCEIDPHVDSGWHAGYYEKFHVAIKSPKGSVFGFENGDLISNEGDVNWFRNDKTHWVINDSNEPRISMIVCIKTDEYKHEH